MKVQAVHVQDEFGVHIVAGKDVGEEVENLVEDVVVFLAVRDARKVHQSAQH